MPKKMKIAKPEKKNLSESEFEKKVMELADKGLTCEKIGEKLRQEGIHPKEHHKKISKILKEKGKYVNPDLKNIEEKLGKLEKHREKHKQDKKAIRDKDRIFAKLNKLKKYFKVAIK